MKEILRYMIVSFEWLAACALLAGFGINLPDKIYYPGLAIVLVIAACIFHMEV